MLEKIRVISVEKGVNADTVMRHAEVSVDMLAGTLVEHTSRALCAHIYVYFHTRVHTMAARFLISLSLYVYTCPCTYTHVYIYIHMCVPLSLSFSPHILYAILCVHMRV